MANPANFFLGGTLAQLQQNFALRIELIIVLRIALIRVRLRIEIGLSWNYLRCIMNSDNDEPRQ